MKKALLRIIALSLGPLFLASIAGAEEDKDTLSYPTAYFTVTLDPAMISSRTDKQVSLAVFEGLVLRHPKTLEPIPGAAQSWTISKDEKTYLFELNPKSVWVKKEKKLRAVTADDFILAWKRVLHKENHASYRFLFEEIQGVTEYISQTDIRHDELIRKWSKNNRKVKSLSQIPEAAKRAQD